MGGKSAPRAPNYRAAAEEQAASDQEMLRQQTWANRPTQNTPFGSVTWETGQQIDPATGQPVTSWTQNYNLTPEMQQALDYQMGLQLDRSRLAGGLFDRAADEFGPVSDWSQFEGYGDPGETAGLGDRYVQEAEDARYNQWANRMEPRLEQQRAAMETQLRNQGMAPGDEAYDYQMNQLMQQQQDARTNAQYQATIGAGQEAARMHGMASADFGQRMQAANYGTQIRQQQIAEELQRRGMTLNEINAIMTGQQVGMTPMPQFNAAGRGAATNYLGAANMQGQANLNTFNAEQAAMQGMMGGIAGIGTAFLPGDW